MKKQDYNTLPKAEATALLKIAEILEKRKLQIEDIGDEYGQFAIGPKGKDLAKHGTSLGEFSPFPVDTKLDENTKQAITDINHALEEQNLKISITEDYEHRDYAIHDKNTSVEIEDGGYSKFTPAHLRHIPGWARDNEISR